MDCKIGQVAAGRRQQHKDQLREQIRTTALQLFHQRGFDQTRVADIIGAVGISEKTFFNYFASKQAVLEADATDLLALYQALLEHEVAGTHRTMTERLTEIVNLWADSFSDDRDYLATVVTRTGAFFGATGALPHQQQTAQRLLAELFRQGQASGEVRADHDPHQLAEVLTATLLLTTINWLGHWHHDTGQPLRERLQHALGILLTGTLTTTQPPPDSPHTPH